MTRPINDGSNTNYPYAPPSTTKNYLVQSALADHEVFLKTTHDARPLTIIEYCTEEVRRQGHDTASRDGIERVGWMLGAWGYAMYEKDFALSRKFDITIRDIEELGRMVEVDKNCGGFRDADVWVQKGDRLVQSFPKAVEILDRLESLLDRQADLAPLDFYREFLEVHPFVDGNGRVGKILLNWKNCSLTAEPVFPPADFWGDIIVNP